MTLPGARPDRTSEVLYFDACPPLRAAGLTLPEPLDQTGVRIEVKLRLVESEEDARACRFVGSPAVRVDGRDVEPNADARTDYGLKCRLYRTRDGIVGLPRDALIIDALSAGAATGSC